MGYWGEPTSSVDWCERNYEHTPYVAELFNTLSSFAMVAFGVFGLVAHRRVLERRFLFAFVLLSVVGVGSVLFHATLRFELQLLDELPMVYLVLLMVWILVEDGEAPRFGRVFPIALVAWAAVLTVLTAFTRGDVQFWAFQLSFGSLELFSLGAVARLYRRSTNLAARRLFRFGIGAYTAGILVWFVDLRLCAYLTPNPQLHAFWHLLVSFGFYALLLVIAMFRADKLERPLTLTRAGLLPVLDRTATRSPGSG